VRGRSWGSGRTSGWTARRSRSWSSPAWPQVRPPGRGPAQEVSGASLPPSVEEAGHEGPCLGPLGTPQMKALHEDLWDIFDSNDQDSDKVKGGIALDAFPGLGKTTAVLALRQTDPPADYRRRGKVHRRGSRAMAGLPCRIDQQHRNARLQPSHLHAPQRTRPVTTLSAARTWASDDGFLRPQWAVKARGSPGIERGIPAIARQ
jgi:hypothetical protein